MSKVNDLTYKLPAHLMKELKAVIEKNSGKECSEKLALEAADLLSTLARLALDQVMSEQKLKKRLTELPKGFSISGTGYTCQICSNKAAKWYDRYGKKCMICQKAVDDKIVPGSIVNNHDSWYSIYDLDYYFNLNGKILNQCIKIGLLKPRIITSENNKQHLSLFLRADHKGFLPPKKLLKSKTAKVVVDGKSHLASLRWHQLENPFKRLEKYKITEYLRLIQI